MSHLTQSMVEQFFELEKESARGVLRKEMDSAMDTIFKQMKRKLMQLVESGPGPDETAHGLSHLGNPTDHEQQLSNDTSHNSSTPTNSQAQFGDVNASNLSLQGGSCDRVQDEQQLSSSTNRIPSTSTDFFVPDNANSNQYDEIVVKNKLGELVNIIPTPTSSTQSQPSNDNDKDDNLFDELDEDEEDCDCSECMEGLSVNEEEGDDDNGNSQSVEDLIDERNDSVSRPNKRPRLENVQVQDQAQPNNQTNPTQVIIIIRFKCSQCSEMFEDKNKLNAHLNSVHSILKYRCLYKDCNRSFDIPMDLACHQSTAHSERPNIMLPCGYCSGHYKDRKSLFDHYTLYHEEGVFRCSYAECQFVADLRQKVINHSRIDHKDFVCEYPGCAKRFSGASILKTHQLTHLNAKPYRCKWPNCKFAGSAYKPNAIKHINTHLKKLVKPKMGTNISDDPNYYLEVHEM